MKKSLVIISAICCFIQAQSMAADQAQQGSQSIRFEDLKEACSNPARFHNQVAPQNIQISCTEMKTKWLEDIEGAVALPTKRLVVTSVISNKYTVSPSTAQMLSEPQSAGCANFKQVIETLDTAHSTTCEELLAYKGTGEEYCASNLDDIRIASPDSIKMQETGKKFGFCNVKSQKD
jgi:hypothetical protein